VISLFGNILKIIVTSKIQKTMTNLAALKKIVRNIEELMLGKPLMSFRKRTEFCTNSSVVRFENIFT